MGFVVPGSNFHHTADSQEVHSVESPFVMRCTTRLDAKPNPRDDQRVTREVHHSSIDRAIWTTEKPDEEFFVSETSLKILQDISRLE